MNASDKVAHHRLSVCQLFSPSLMGKTKRSESEGCSTRRWGWMRAGVPDHVDALQVAPDRWLLYYNTQRPHQGYRNMGRRPIDTVQLYLKPVTKEG